MAAVTATPRRPYSPSWIDRLTAWIAGLPIPEGVVYIAIALAAFGLLTFAQWFGGAYPVGQVKPTHAAVATAIGAYLWLARRFNVAAGAAVRGLGPMLTVNAARASDLEYRLTTLPAAPTLILGLAVSALTLVRIVLYPESVTRIDITLDPISLVLTRRSSSPSRSSALRCPSRPPPKAGSSTGSRPGTSWSTSSRSDLSTPSRR